MKEFLYKTFLDIHKSYYALDQGHCLDILAAYIVPPWALRLLCRYWDHLTMVARAGGYSGDPFKSQHGVNQGSPLSFTIFNVVIDAVLQKLATTVAATERTPESVTEGVQAGH